MIKYTGLSTLENLEGGKRYNTWIVDQFLSSCKYPLLEIGSGLGTIGQKLGKGKKIYLSDIDNGLVTYLKKKFKSNKNIFAFSYDITQKPHKKYLNFFSAVIGINVLEHIKNDEQALKNIHAILAKNGKVLLLVPANQFAYTVLDKKLGHFRRYEKKELAKKLENNGFIIEKLYPFNFLGLVGWFLLYKMHWKPKELKSSHINLFEYFVPLLRIIESIVPIPIGISLIAIARKKG